MRIFIFGLFFLLLVSSCSQDVRFNNKLKGTWNIKEIQSSLNLEASGYFIFESCEFEKDNRQLCDVTFQLSNNTSSSTKYSFIPSTRDKIATISFGLPESEPFPIYFPSGTFEVEELTKKELVLRGNIIKWNHEAGEIESNSEAIISLVKVN